MKKAIDQIARSHGVHPVILTHWTKEFIEKKPEIFSQQTTTYEYGLKLVLMARGLSQGT